MHQATIHRRAVLAAASALLASVLLLPAAASPHKDTQGKQSHCERIFVTPEQIHAQNLVFPGHDGHIMPPTSQDWAQYHAAEARAQADRPLFCDPPPRDGHNRRKH